MHRYASAPRINGSQRPSLGLPTQYRSPILGQRPVAVVDDLVGTVGAQANYVVGGGVVRDCTKLLSLGDEEDVVGRRSGWAEGEEVGDPTVDWEGKEEGKRSSPH